MADLNGSTVSAANAAAIRTIGAQPGQRVRLKRVDAFTSAGTSTLTVEDATTVIFRSATNEITSTRLSISWTFPLTGQPGNAMTITASAAGAGNTVTLNTQAEQVGG